MRVLVAYLARPDGEAALRAGIDLARRLDGAVLVASAVHAGPREVPADQTAATFQRLQDLELPDGAGEVEIETRQLVTNRPGSTALVELARQWRASMLVCGIRNRTPVGKALMGSVSQDLILSAPCPVLAVRANYS